MNQNLNYQEKLNQALKVEHEKVFDYSTKQLKNEFSKYVNSCPLCNSKKTKIYCVKDYYIYVRCKKCSFVYLNPRLNNKATLSYYNSKVNEIYNETKFHVNDVLQDIDYEQNKANYNLIKNHTEFSNGFKILEIGPGKGNHLKELRKRGLDINVIELNEFLNKDLNTFCNKVYNKDLLDLNLEDNSFDLIYSRDVMEHISDPIPYFSECFRILKSGGMMMIDTHNIDSLINMITGKYHTVIFGFEHPIHWSQKTLKFACEKVGFKTVHCYNSVGTDFSLGSILNYYMFPSFTYIYPSKRNKFLNKIYKLINRIIFIKYIRKVDTYIFKNIERITNKGSKMQMVFRK